MEGSGEEKTKVRGQGVWQLRLAVGWVLDLAVGGRSQRLADCAGGARSNTKANVAWSVGLQLHAVLPLHVNDMKKENGGGSGLFNKVEVPAVVCAWLLDCSCLGWPWKQKDVRCHYRYAFVVMSMIVRP
eukprot:631756-Pelagomonas_calceolata.AAC.4